MVNYKGKEEVRGEQSRRRPNLLLHPHIGDAGDPTRNKDPLASLHPWEQGGEKHLEVSVPVKPPRRGGLVLPYWQLWVLVDNSFGAAHSCGGGGSSSPKWEG